MALDERYIVASDLEQYFVDKDSGLPLSAGTLEFFSDVSRTTPKPVYQLSGAPPDYTYTSMGAVITLSAVGTVQNSGGDNEVIYYYPFDADGNLELYYIVCRDSNGVEQFSREAWPNITAANNPMTDTAPITNQIANPQFTQVFLNEGFTTTCTVSAATDQEFIIAPDWSLLLSGTGTVTLQRIAVSGNETVVTSPPYVLDITVSSGITACKLRQRFATNSGLWASTDTQSIFLAGAYVARNQNAGTSGIQMFYKESTGGLPVLIMDGTFDNAAFTQVTGVTADPIPLSTNSDEGTAGYIDIYLSLLPSSHIRVSSIQVVPTLDQAGADFLEYDLNSSNREIVNLGDYYLPNLNARPTPSLLVGWDFVVAPFQFGTSGTITTTPAYICDQTIACCGSSGNVAFSRDANSNGLAFVTAGTNDAFYLMQYLSAEQAHKIMGTPLSVNLFGYRTSASDDVTVRVYLVRASDNPAYPTLPATIGTLASDGTFTITDSNWVGRELARCGLDTTQASGLDTAKAILPYVSYLSAPIDINQADTGFEFWEVVLGDQARSTGKFAIIVTFAYVDTSTALTVNSISLTPGRIPCRPAPQTADEVLRECQYFYEKSYALSTPEATVTSTGQILVSTGVGQSGGNDVLATKSFTVNFNTIKRKSPTVRLYSPSSATPNQISVSISVPATSITSANVSTGRWALVNSVKAASYTANNASINVTSSPSSPISEGLLAYHYAADARLGIVA